MSEFVSCDLQMHYLLLYLTVIKQKTIYEYHRVDLKEKDDYQIINDSAIIFELQDTCLSYETCEDCTTSMTNFNVSTFVILI